jgi:CheY-like chemotaxis protein
VSRADGDYHATQGLGLFVARAFARAMGGDLVAERAEPGPVGLVLRLRVPVCIPTAAAAAPPPPPGAAAAGAATPVLKRSASAARLTSSAGTPPTPAPQLRHRPPRCLLIDDHELNLKLVSRLLQKHGFEVGTAVNGADGLAQLQASVGAGAAPDLVLCDLQMPVLGGIDMARQYRAWEAAQQPPKPRLLLLALSANVSDALVREAEQAGMDGYLSKARCMLACMLAVAAHAL